MQIRPEHVNMNAADKHEQLKGGLEDVCSIKIEHKPFNLEKWQVILNSTEIMV